MTAFKSFFTGHHLIFFYNQRIKIWVVPSLDRPCGDDDGTTRTSWRSSGDQSSFRPPDVIIPIPLPLIETDFRKFQLPGGHWDPRSGTSLIFDTIDLPFIDSDDPQPLKGARWALTLPAHPESSSKLGTADLKLLSKFNFLTDEFRLKDWSWGYSAPNGDPLQPVCLEWIEALEGSTDGSDEGSPDGGSSTISEDEYLVRYCYSFYSISERQSKPRGPVRSRSSPPPYLTRVTNLHIICRDPPPSNVALCPASGRLVYFRCNDVPEEGGDEVDPFERRGFDEGQEQEEYVEGGDQLRKPTLCVLDYLN